MQFTCESFLGGPASGKWERRVGMFIRSFIVLVGAIVMGAAHNVAAYLIGRLLAGFGVAIARSAAPSYVAEISAPQ